MGPREQDVFKFIYMRILFALIICLLNTNIFSQPVKGANLEKDTSIQAFIEYKFIESFHNGEFAGESSNGTGYIKFHVQEGLLSNIITSSEMPLKIDNFLKKVIVQYFLYKKSHYTKRSS